MIRRRCHEQEITEGHTRPLLMLMDRTEEQKVLFKEIIAKRLTVRDSEQLARRVAVERVRKSDLTPELLLLERELTERLGTRVRIEKKDQGGKVLIDFFSVEDLANIRSMLSKERQVAQVIETQPQAEMQASNPDVAAAPSPAPSAAGKSKEEEDLYSINNFTL